jgi:hypothetical protein
MDFTLMQKMSQWIRAHRPFQRRSERIEITIETSETWDLEWRSQSRNEVCPKCGCESTLLPLNAGSIDALAKNIGVPVGDAHHAEGTFLPGLVKPLVRKPFSRTKNL